MQFPLNLSFKVVTLVPQIYVTDANDKSVLYVRQKLLKFKEEVTVFRGPDQDTPIYKIKADRVIDWSARYTFQDVNGAELGSVKRHGTRSLWRSHYDIYDGLVPKMTIREANPFTKIADGLLGLIPILGFLSAYLFHPTYNVTNDQDGRVVMRLRKRPSLFQRRFSIEKEDDGIADREQEVVLLSLLMMILLERGRG